MKKILIVVVAIVLSSIAAHAQNNICANCFGHRILFNTQTKVCEYLCNDNDPSIPKKECEKGSTLKCCWKTSQSYHVDCRKVVKPYSGVKGSKDSNNKIINDKVPTTAAPKNTRPEPPTPQKQEKPKQPTKPTIKGITSANIKK